MKHVMLQPLIDDFMTTPTMVAADVEIFVLDEHLRVVLRGTSPGDLAPVARVDDALPAALQRAIEPVATGHDFETDAIAQASADGVAIRIMRLAGGSAAFYAVMTVSPAR